MKIAIVLGTAREGNSTKKVANFIGQKIKEQNFETEFVDVSDYLFTKTVVRSDADSVHGEKIEKWANIIESSDAVIFVTPEYNHSYPGELKNLIDSLYPEYKNKFAGVISVSMGNYGGSRVTELLKLLLVTVNFRVINKSVLVSNVGEIDNVIDDENNVIDSESEFLSSIEKQLNGVLEEIK